MKNLFDYATKELSQDAFLRWLFENYNCENEKVRQVCNKLFNAFTNNELDFSKIDKNSLRTVAQWKNIDVSIWFSVQGKEYLIIIEDKTTSEEHLQLKNYNEKIQEHKDWLIKNENKTIEKVYKVFYKTAKISEIEKKRIEEAGWNNILDIKSIYDIFNGIDKTDSEVLDYYIEHIKSLNKLFVDYKDVPINEWRKNFLIFTNYCDDVIKQYCDSFHVDHYRSQVYQGKYAETYIQKNLPNNITVELGLFFRDWGYSAWIKVWNTNLGWKTPFQQKEKVKELCECNSRLTWKNKPLKNRIKIIKQAFTENLIYEEFNCWMEKCLKDYFDFWKKL